MPFEKDLDLLNLVAQGLNDVKAKRIVLVAQALPTDKKLLTKCVVLADMHEKYTKVKEVASAAFEEVVEVTFAGTRG